VERVGAWPTRLTWAILPLLMGPTLADGLGGVSRPVQLVASVGLWAGWAAVLVATLIPATTSLTVVRLATPAAVVTAVAATVAGGVEPLDVVGLTSALVAALAAFSPVTADVFVDGSSYGDERRMSLRVAAPLLVGPIELMWVAVAAGVVAGPLLLAARQWLAGAVALPVGLLLAQWGTRVLHTLSRRWLVFVPAGLVVHDPLALAQPVLVPRSLLRSFGPAPADTDALDLTNGALGLALELQVEEPLTLTVVRGRGQTGSVTTDKLLVTPSRPGAVLAEARQRRLA
jgi:hypothetical protein